MHTVLPSGLELTSAYLPEKLGNADESIRHRVWLYPIGEPSGHGVTMTEAVASMADAFRDTSISAKPHVAVYLDFIRSFHPRHVVDQNEGGKSSPFRLQAALDAIILRAQQRQDSRNLDTDYYDQSAELLGHRVGALDLMVFAGHILTHTALEGDLLDRSDPRVNFLDELRTNLVRQ